jgi:hypothetical protein
MINTEKSGPDLGLATRDPDIRTCDLEAPFVFSLSLCLLYAILIWAASLTLFHIVHIIYLLFNSFTLLFLI